MLNRFFREGKSWRWCRLKVSIQFNKSISIFDAKHEEEREVRMGTMAEARWISAQREALIKQLEAEVAKHEEVLDLRKARIDNLKEKFAILEDTNQKIRWALAHREARNVALEAQIASHEEERAVRMDAAAETRWALAEREAYIDQLHGKIASLNPKP